MGSPVLDGRSAGMDDQGACIGRLLGVDVRQGERTDLTFQGRERLGVSAAAASNYRAIARVPEEKRQDAPPAPRVRFPDENLISTEQGMN